MTIPSSRNFGGVGGHSINAGTHKSLPAAALKEDSPPHEAWQMGAGQRHQVRLADGRSKETAFTGISGDCGSSISPRVEAANTLSKTMFILNASKTVWNHRFIVKEKECFETSAGSGWKISSSESTRYFMFMQSPTVESSPRRTLRFNQST
ncbi:predicted protein [Histoplasma capsulatum H143]|uniref:Uncharacterized protein n=1 Tax=Ajellomyces capsulatus (strain H143) TaxID=544712 RepID=C6H6Y2_AJECH|nr:predicted protein [Histoplasma capsulatum H143]